LDIAEAIFGSNNSCNCLRQQYHKNHIVAAYIPSGLVTIAVVVSDESDMFVEYSIQKTNKINPSKSPRFTIANKR
jgi:hypothetical protein